MDSKKRKALEAAGWKIGDAADFLELSDKERRSLDARVKANLARRRPGSVDGRSRKGRSDGKA